MDRRAFLGGSASSLFAAPITGAVSSPKQYRIGIIGRTGKGNYGHGLDTVWKSIPSVQVVAVADDNKVGLASAVERTGAATGYQDYRKMLDSEQLDLVAVSPRWLDKHHEITLACAESDCHVYMEKPFCRTMQEADEIVGAFEKKNLKLAIAHVNRYRPEFDIVKRMIEQGAIGKVVEARARGKEDRRGGGEDLWVLGTHVLDLMHGFCGRVTSCFATVKQSGMPVTKEHVKDGSEGIGPLAGDHVEAVYQFENHATGHFASRRDRRGNPSRFALRIYGSEGVIEFPSAGPVHLLNESCWSASRSGGKWVPILSAIEPAEAKALAQLPQGNQAAVLDLIEAIEQDRPPKSNVYDARAATEMIVSVFESHRQGRPVKVPLENRRNPLAMLG